MTVSGMPNVCFDLLSDRVVAVNLVVVSCLMQESDVAHFLYFFYIVSNLETKSNNAVAVK